jgi:hypothetical protein
VTEAELQHAVIEYARLFGWTVAHFRVAQTKRGWRTPVAADGAGFPDLVLVRGPRLIFAELKSASGRLRDEQEHWIRRLGTVADAVDQAVADSALRDYDFDEPPAVEVHEWRPDDWLSGRIDQALGRPAKEEAA